MKAIDTIEGIGAGYAGILRSAGIPTVEALLEVAGKKSARKRLAVRLGISEKLIQRWVNMADLFRVKGIGGQFAELLELSGVDSVPELAQRNAASLRDKMIEVNEARRVIRRMPPRIVVEAWIHEAGTLPKKVWY